MRRSIQAGEGGGGGLDSQVRAGHRWVTADPVVIGSQAATTERVATPREGSGKKGHRVNSGEQTK